MGFRWHVGSRENIRVLKNPWFPCPHLFKPITQPNFQHKDFRVADLIYPKGVWNANKVRKVFWEVESTIVLAILLSYVGIDDM